MLKNVAGLKLLRRDIASALLIVVLLLVVSSVVFGRDLLKVQSLSQTAKQLLEISQEQYNRQFYEDSERTLLKAARYKEYLNAEETKKFNSLLKKIDAAVSKRRQVVDHLAKGRELLKKKEFLKAKAHLLTALKSEYLAEDERQALLVEIQILDERTNLQKQTISETYNKSVEAFNAGELDKAYEGFSKIAASGVKTGVQGQNAEDYLYKISRLSGATSLTINPTPANNTELIDGELVKLEPRQLKRPGVNVGQENVQETYIDVVNQKRRIQQGYTQAIVNDAITKAEKLIEANNFTKAKDALTGANGLVNKNKLLLGSELYKSYTDKLNELLNDIISRQEQYNRQIGEEKRIEAEKAKRDLMERQDKDRAKRINDLMNNALEYQDQQRYTEALGQLDTLLAIDPTHRQAKISKRILEDTMNLRRQLEVQRQGEQQELDILAETDRAMIPFADEVTFPANWQEITNKRGKARLEAMEPLDAAVYRQLDEVVDISELHPDMAFEEAIDVLRKAADPPLKLTVRWKNLFDNAAIDRETPIEMQGLSGITLSKGIKELLEQISGGIVELAYSVDGGVITVATKDSLPVKMISRAYDVTELIGAPSRSAVDLNIESSSGDDISLSEQVDSGSSDMTQMQEENVSSIIATIQETIEPDSWYINGGEGTITAHSNKLIIRQTPEIHAQIHKLLMEDLRESLGQQVSIEARFLFVSENFLQDIGIDTTFMLKPFGNFTAMTFSQNSYEFAAAGGTTVPGSLAANLAASGPALDLVGGGFYGDPTTAFIDNLTVEFMLRATEAHRDARALTAPKVTVLSGESASIQVLKEKAYVSNYDFETIESGDNNLVTSTATPEIEKISDGVILNVKPTISGDKRYVLLEISTSFTRANLEDFSIPHSETGEAFPIQLPVKETAAVQTRVSVPDCGTLLIGGQKLGAQVNKEAGTPGLSKLPLIGGLFRNRSKVKDKDILLILVKPTIILQDEKEREAFAPLQ